MRTMPVQSQLTRTDMLCLPPAIFLKRQLCFGLAEQTQDIYNADELNRLLAKTVITRTFKEVTGKEIRCIHQVPLPFLPEEREVYRMVVEEFYKVQREYFASTGNHRKGAMFRIMQQIALLLRVAAAPIR